MSSKWCVLSLLSMLAGTDASCGKCACYPPSIYPGQTHSQARFTPFAIPAEGWNIYREGCHNAAHGGPPTFTATCTYTENEACNAGLCQERGYAMWLHAGQYTGPGCFVWHGGTHPELGLKFGYVGALCNCSEFIPSVKSHFRTNQIEDMVKSTRKQPSRSLQLSSPSPTPEASPSPDSGQTDCTSLCGCHDISPFYPMGYNEADEAFALEGAALASIRDATEGCHDFDPVAGALVFRLACSYAENTACNAGWCQEHGYAVWLRPEQYEQPGCYLWHGGTRPELGLSFTYVGSLCSCQPSPSPLPGASPLPEASPSPDAEPRVDGEADRHCKCGCHDISPFYPMGYSPIDAPFALEGAFLALMRNVTEGCHDFDPVTSDPVFRLACSYAENTACSAGWCQEHGYAVWLRPEQYEQPGCYLWHGGTRPELGLSFTYVGSLCSCQTPPALPPPSAPRAFRVSSRVTIPVTESTKSLTVASLAASIISAYNATEAEPTVVIVQSTTIEVDVGSTPSSDSATYLASVQASVCGSDPTCSVRIVSEGRRRKLVQASDEAHEEPTRQAPQQTGLPHSFSAAHSPYPPPPASDHDLLSSIWRFISSIWNGGDGSIADASKLGDVPAKEELRRLSEGYTITFEVLLTPESSSTLDTGQANALAANLTSTLSEVLGTDVALATPVVTSTAATISFLQLGSTESASDALQTTLSSSEVTNAIASELGVSPSDIVVASATISFPPRAPPPPPPPPSPPPFTTSEASPACDACRCTPAPGGGFQFDEAACMGACTWDTDGLRSICANLAI